MIHLERLLKHGKLRHLESKPLIRRLKIGVENAVRPTFGGVELIDLTFSFPVALIYACVFIVLFVLFAYWNYETKKPILTLLPNQPKGMICEPIAKSIQGIFNADLNGNWQNDPLYLEEKSIFVLTSYGKLLSKEQFNNALDYFKGEFKYLSKTGKRPLAWNVPVLSSVGFKHPDTGLGMTTSTDPSYIFDLVIKVATLSNQKGVCLGQDAVPSRGLQAQYLSGVFKPEQAALALHLPFRINASSVRGGTSRGFSTTFTPSVEEPCPLHGNWFRNIFIGADAEYRSGSAEIGFDIRSAMTAIALNMGRINLDALIKKVSNFTVSLGLIGFVDPYYTFPPFQRIYCVDKSSPMWNHYKFSSEEKREQIRSMDANYRVMNPTFKPASPNICLLTPATKSTQIKFYYPMTTSLKWDRDDCWSTERGCQTGTPSTRSPNMFGCTCPADTKNIDCNRDSFVTSFYYDTNFPSSLMRGTAWNSTKTRLPNDNAFKLGIAVQRLMTLKWMRDAKIGEAYDLKAMALFDDVVAATLSVYNNPAAANTSFPANNPSSSTSPPMTSRSRLAAAWSQLLSNVPNLTHGPLAPLSAIVFRSTGVYGQGHNILPINQFNLQMSDLTTLSPQATKYWDSYPQMEMPAAACADPFYFDAAFDRMKLNPPAPLIEPYFKCSKNDQLSNIVALGSAYSSANVICTLLWAISGTLMVWCWKRYLRGTNSPESVVSLRTKRRLEGLLQELKDESLVGVVDDLLARLAALERQSRTQMKRGIGPSGRDEEEEEEENERRQVFYSLHDPKTKNDFAVAQRLRERANEDMHQQLEKFKADTLRRFSTATGSKPDSSAAAADEGEQEQEQEMGLDDQGEAELEMRWMTTSKRSNPPTFSPTHRLHELHIQSQQLQHQQQEQKQSEPDSAHSEWDGESTGPGDDQTLSLSFGPFTHNPQHQHHHQHQRHSVNALSAVPSYAHEEVLAMARRKSQKISLPSGSSDNATQGPAAMAARKAKAAMAVAERGNGPLPPKRLSVHPISAVLSTITPPSASSRVLHK